MVVYILAYFIFTFTKNLCSIRIRANPRIDKVFYFIYAMLKLKFKEIISNFFDRSSSDDSSLI